MYAPERVGSPVGKPGASAEAKGVLEVIFGGGVTIEEADCLELLGAALKELVLAAALEADDWSGWDEEAAAEVASEVADVAVGLDAVGIALLVEPVSCGRFPCATAIERRMLVMNRQSIISETGDERREDGMLAAVLQYEHRVFYDGVTDPRDDSTIWRRSRGEASTQIET